MNENVSFEVINKAIAPLFYQCPFGGFASLHPGVCPKCQETLMPVRQAASTVSKEYFHQAYMIPRWQGNDEVRTP